MSAILGIGDYKVYLDAGFLTNAFRLNSSQLNGTDVLNGTTQFFEVTTYVKGVQISRGRQKFREPINPGRCTIRIDDRDGDFSVVNSNSPYWDPDEDRLGFQPTRRVRIEREGERIFDGQIVTYDQQITLDNESNITIVATDDLKVFDRVTVDAHTPTQQRSDQRLEAILNRAEVNLFTGAGQRVVSEGISTLGTQPVEAGVSVDEYFDRVQLCEQGRIFIDRQGRFNAQPRVGRALRSISAEFSDVQDGKVPFRNFQVVYE